MQPGYGLATPGDVWLDEQHTPWFVLDNLKVISPRGGRAIAFNRLVDRNTTGLLTRAYQAPAQGEDMTTVSSQQRLTNLRVAAHDCLVAATHARNDGNLTGAQAYEYQARQIQTWIDEEENFGPPPEANH
ncbi:hypothetical protein [Actinomadura sp. 6N118]|uniref:hypothetical protein n=1 Tax=Actinomadura sp. 6N118 TaxID=3375151 RepID=UPI0037B56441